MVSKKRQKKMQISSDIAEKLARAKSVTLTDYRGLTTVQLLELRQKLAETGAEFQVTKNSLLKRALQQQGYSAGTTTLEGPTATLFAYEDEVAPLKVLTAFAKTTQLPAIKAGFLGKDFLDANRVTTLAKLPSKDVLIGQVIGTMNAPITGVVNVLQANIRNLVYVLSAIKQKSSASS